MYSQKYLTEALEQRLLLNSYPAGFVENRIATNLQTPTAIAFAPDGRLFVAQQSGEIRVIEHNQLLPANFAQVNANFVGERGLLGLTLDPTFGQPGGLNYVYVYYTTTNGVTIHNRVSRFTANGNVAAGGEQVIIELPDIALLASAPLWHMGGAMNFGPDGKLYISQGDTQDSEAAQSLSVLKGKILRFNKDGSIPGDNPFYDSVTGMSRAIWAYGLRNPFTTTWEPATGRFFINDVGQDLWEEIDTGVAGANYGWPTTEGDFDQSQFPIFTRPTFTYYHNLGTCIVGGAFYTGANAAQFPPEYQGKYFFGDYAAGWIKTYDLQTGQVQSFGDGMRFITGLSMAPDGTIWYVTRGVGEESEPIGAIYQIQFTTSDAPIITEQPQDQLIAVGESATFSVQVDGQAPFEFQWQRNGTDIDGANGASYTVANATFADNGSGFRCIVTNNVGTAVSAAATLAVAQTTRPTPTILAPVVNTMYSGGERIDFSGFGIDEQDGVLADAAFTWRVDFHHDTHSHPFIPDMSGVKSGSFVIPTTGETSDNVWYRILLTVTDSAGLSATVTRDIEPRKATLELSANLPGLSLTLDGQPRTLPVDIVGVQGLSRVLDAPQTQVVDGEVYHFIGWSDDGEAAHTIAFPSADTTYTAFYQAVAQGSPVIVTGTAGTDDWLARLSTNGTRLLVFRNGVQQLSVILAGVDTVTFNGLAGDDSLTLDSINGPFTGVGQIIFNGGTSVTNGDLLRVIGTNQSDTFDVAGDRVFFHALPVNYSDVENLRIEPADGNDLVRVNAAIGATLQLVAPTGDNELSIFGGAATIDTDLSNFAVTVNNDGIINFTKSQHLASLALTGNARASLASGAHLLLRTKGLSIDGHGVFDLNDNDLLLDYSGPSELAAIQAMISRARAGGAWTGEGLTSSAAGAINPHITTLGVLESADYLSVYGPGATFDGDPLDNSAVLVKYTYYGDTDFNGIVNFDDYARTDTGFLTQRSGWLNGDFDGNGVVNFDDYSLIDFAFNAQSTPLRPAAQPPRQAPPARRLRLD